MQGTLNNLPIDGYRYAAIHWKVEVAIQVGVRVLQLYKVGPSANEQRESPALVRLCVEVESSTLLSVARALVRSARLGRSSFSDPRSES